MKARNIMLFNNYLKPGKGVNKRDPNQPRIQIFKDVLPRKLWDLFKLNILYILVAMPSFVITMLIVGAMSSSWIESLIPIYDNVGLIRIDILLRVILAFWFMIFLGQGPVTAGYTYIIREHSREHHCWFKSDFFERTKSNFKQGMMLWIIDLVVFYLFAVSFKFYAQNNQILLQYAVLVIGVLYLIMHIYVYQMMITFELQVKSILKNSLVLAVAKAPVSLPILLLNIIIYAVVPISIALNAKNLIVIVIMILIEVLILPPITSFATIFYIDPILDKHININNIN